jgi:hemerythrin-like metal-binding protein
MRFIRENKNFLTIIIASFVLLSVVILFGGRLIFENEMEARDDKAISEMSHASEVSKIFFSGLKHNLFFLRNREIIKAYADSDFRSFKYRKQVLDAFIEYARSYDYTYRIKIVDLTGNEILGIDNTGNTATVTVHDSQPGDEKERRHLDEDRGLGMEEAAISIVVANTKESNLSAPVGRIAAPLYDSGNERKGILILEIKLSDFFDLLPAGMFIQSYEGYSIYKKQDGPIGAGKSSYVFGGKRGKLVLSDEKSVYYSAVEVSPGQKLIIALDVSNNETKLFLMKLVFAALFIFALYFCLMLSVSYMNIRNHRQLELTQKAIIFSLVNLVELRDPETGFHLERTRNYGVILAGQLSQNKKHKRVITDKFIEDLYNASPLHDIGKVGITDSILLKEGKLTDQEFDSMKKHVTIGKDILSRVTENLKHNKHFLVMSRNIATYHHERYDGTGYPEQLKKDDIPLEARIYALCDSYDAIRAKRPYKEPLSHEEAVKRILAGSGEHFDPDIVDAFLKCDTKFNEIYETYKLFVERYVAVSDFADYKELKVQWMPSLSLGIDAIDNQHRELIDIINSLLKAIVKGSNKKEISGVIKFLEDYTALHFGTEEGYMIKYNYAGYHDHLSQHLEFVEKLHAVKKNYGERGASSEAVINLINQLIEWLINHISITDKTMGIFLAQNIASKKNPDGQAQRRQV